MNNNNILYRYRKCNSNLTSNTKFSQYQRLKIIQNTVRVPSSIFLMNLSALNTIDYTPKQNLYRWNQMSDRNIPHYQPNKTITKLRPGNLSPGGYGGDIKHNSYNRYLNKIKGNILKRGKFIINNNDINVKTSIISNCNCNDNYNLINDDEIQQPLFNTIFTFYVGEIVNVFIDEINTYEKSKIISFKDNNIVEVFIIKYNVYVNVPIYYLSRHIHTNKCTSSTSTQDEITELIKINNTDNTIKVNQLICNL